MATQMSAPADAVLRHAETARDALLAGDVEGLISELSDELKRNVGEVVALLPLPLRDAEITSVEQSGKTSIVTMALMGEIDAVDLTTRWKDRDGEPRIVEVSHVARTPALPELELDGATDADVSPDTAPA